MGEIDVSKCEFYQDDNGIEIQGCYERTDICELEDVKETGKSCCDIKYCYYKQLQRVKQKLEKIKEECQPAPAIDTELSLRILQIIEE